MGTLTTLFDLTRSSLAADQAALNATANNVANQNTTGYVRQVATFSAGDTVSLGQGNGYTYSGPSVTLESKRDRVLEQRVQQQTQVAAASGAQASALSEVEDVFSLSGSSSTAGATQIGTALDSFFSSLTALASAPTDAATRQGVLSAAQVLASSFNSAATQLAQVKSSTGAEVSTSVLQVNALTATIATLNGQIQQSSPDADAGSLENQRQTAIAQLSQLVGLHQVTTESNGISLTTDGGALLVAGSTASVLTAANVGGKVQVQDAAGNDVSGTITGGSIGGALTAENVTVPGVQAALDAVAFRVGAAVNAQNAAGLDANGNAGGTIFAVGTTSPGAAAAITVVATSASAIATAGAGEGTSGNTNATALEELGTTTDASGTTISGQFAGLISQVGTDSSAISEQNTADTASLTQLTTQRDSLSGVSLDDEASNLSEYQRSYQAAAKVLSVLDELLAAAINIGTQTAVS